jgi:hypothetical protein
MTGSTTTEADCEFARWRNRVKPRFDISRQRFNYCPTLRTQSGASSTNSSRIFFCCQRRDENMKNGFFEAWLRCPKQKTRKAPNKRTCREPAAPLAHRRPGYPLSGCVPAEPDSVSPGNFSIAIQFPTCQPINRPRSRLRTWLRTQILDMRWQLLPNPIRQKPRTTEQTAMLVENAILNRRWQRLHNDVYPPLTIDRSHSSHAGCENAS